MAWFRNYYECDLCFTEWTDEWSCGCDDECPNCGARDMAPCESQNLTEVVEARGDMYIALRSPDDAEDDPRYREIGCFPTLERAEAYLGETPQAGREEIQQSPADAD